MLLSGGRGGKRAGFSLAQVVLPLAAAVVAAHRELAADRRALRIDRAAQVIRIDRRAPAFLVARHHGTAVGVARQELAGHVVAGLQQDRQPATDRVTTAAVDGCWFSVRLYGHRGLAGAQSGSRWRLG
ncbi:hypothetical protein D3C72_1810890 [compost metagenome]